MARSEPGDKMGVCSSYVIMTYARCGATYLGQLLGSTGTLGRPEDWFNGTGYRDRGIADYPLDRVGQAAMMLSAGRSANGVCGLKLSPSRLAQLAGFDWAGALGAPQFVHLARSDRLGRAISEVRATQTGQWRSTSTRRGGPKYDAAAIRSAIRRQAGEEAKVQQFFAWNGIVPLELAYEEVNADGQAAIERIAAFLQVENPGRIDWSAVTMAMQRDATSDGWRERFLAEHSGLERWPRDSSRFGLRRLFGS